MGRTLIKNSDKGTIIKSKPHFETDELVKDGKVIRPKNLGVYLYDEKNEERLTGFIKKINPLDFNKEEFDLIIRGRNNSKPEIIYLEQVVFEEDKIYVKPFNYYKNRDYLVGKFLSYNVFVDNYEVKPEDFIFGKIYSVNEVHKGLNLSMLKKVSQEEYEENIERIFRGDSQ